MGQPEPIAEPLVWFVIPCYNEGSKGDYCIRKTAPIFIGELNHLIESGKCAPQSKICYVDDGSKDDTWALIEELSAANPQIIGMRLSRNRGHQNALLAGLMESIGRCDLTISIDCDGQDDPHAAEKMLDAYHDGYDVAYGVRSSRATDTVFKRTTAKAFYKLINKLGAETVFNHADYRMMSERALEGLSQFGEVNLYLRGLIPLVGFPSTTVEYDRSRRAAGESHYPLKSMISLALNGITSLSIKPIHFISGLGMVLSLIGIVGVVWAIVAALVGNAIQGWASTMCIVSLIGGFQLLALGVIGEYVGKLYLEAKRRPRYIVSEYTQTFE